MHRRWVLPLACCCLLNGCGSDQKPPATTAPPASRIEDRADPIQDQSTVTLRLLAEELNSSRLAANKIASMPAVSDPRARQEILLHASMYRAAYDSRVSRSTSHFVLDPMKENHPPDIGIDPEEFRLRVLGSLDVIGAPIAWVTETWRSQGVDRFPEPPGAGDSGSPGSPGSSAPPAPPGPVATRLRISILERDENTGIVIGEVGDWTAGGGASKQGVTCRWDGLTWRIERDPVRMVW
jgi:hypothetical protein